MVQMQEAMKSLNRVARTPDGEYFLKWLQQFLDFKGSSLSYDNDYELSVRYTIANEVRRKVWIDLRKGLDVEVRNIIEKDEA